MIITVLHGYGKKCQSSTSVSKLWNCSNREHQTLLSPSVDSICVLMGGEKTKVTHPNQVSSRHWWQGAPPPRLAGRVLSPRHIGASGSLLLSSLITYQTMSVETAEDEMRVWKKPAHHNPFLSVTQLHLADTGVKVWTDCSGSGGGRGPWRQDAGSPLQRTRGNARHWGWVASLSSVNCLFPKP